MASCSSSPSSAASQGSQFAYEEEHIKSLNTSLQSHHRANSLPGSLQACVGSFIVPNEGRKKSKLVAAEEKPAVLAQSHITEPSLASDSDSPSYVVTKSTPAATKPTLVNSQASLNINQPQMIYTSLPYQQYQQAQQQQHSNLLNTQYYSPQSQPYVYFSSNQPNSPQQSHPQHQIIQLQNKDASRKISFQLGSHGLKVSSLADQPNLYVYTKPSNSMSKSGAAGPSPYQQQLHQQHQQQPVSPSVVFRTEMTIMPSSFKRNNEYNSSSGSNKPTNIFTFNPSKHFGN